DVRRPLGAVVREEKLRHAGSTGCNRIEVIMSQGLAHVDEPFVIRRPEGRRLVSRLICHARRTLVRRIGDPHIAGTSYGVRQVDGDATAVVGDRGTEISGASADTVEPPTGAINPQEPG